MLSANDNTKKIKYQGTGKLKLKLNTNTLKTEL